MTWLPFFVCVVERIFLCQQVLDHISDPDQTFVQTHGNVSVAGKVSFAAFAPKAAIGNRELSI